MNKLRIVNVSSAFLIMLNITCMVTVQGQPTSTTPFRGSESPSTEPKKSTETSPSGFGTTSSSSIVTTSSAPFSVSTSTTPSQFGSTTFNSPITEDAKLSDCSTPSTLEAYCKNTLTAKEMEFFNNNTSIIGVLAKIIKPHVVYALQEQCFPGNWCLADSYQKELTDGKDRFYETPLCTSDRLWRCLENIGIQRRNCNESELYFLMSTIGLMCDMDAIDGGAIRDECYTRSLEAVHVIYSDMSRTTLDAEKKEACSKYNKQMTNTYACAVNSCNMEQRVFLQDYGPWSWISTNAESVYQSCNMTLQCQGGYKTQNVPSSVVSTNTNPQPQNTGAASELQKQLDNKEAIEESKLNEKVQEIQSVVAAEQVVDEIIDDMFSMTTPSSRHFTSDGNKGGKIVNEQGMDVPANQADVDQTFVYGMVTVTIVVVISLTLVGFMAYKRFSRIRKNYKLGYSQMTEEESRMLKNEYK